MSTRPWGVYSENGYEVSSLGDKRFSPLFARLADGRTIEQAYQLDVKGYRFLSNDWRFGKGKKPLKPNVDLWSEYLALWEHWARENPKLIADLYRRSKGKVLTDAFARGDVCQAHALALILDEYERL